MRKLILTLLSAILLMPTLTRANEGMWLLLFLSQNEAEMKAMGCNLTADDIYSINHGSLKDAICQFGGGCTGEIISDKGLILTNHHCGFDYIQTVSTLEKNYLKDGFWAYSTAEEIPAKGCTATFIVSMADITKGALEGTQGIADEAARQKLIDDNIARIKSTTVRESWQEVDVRSFFDGNLFILFVKETFKDVRLVGTPPEAIGKFGSDTDNWVWPRHTGDFSMFRVYADKNNRPAEYSADNQPYKPKHVLPVSAKGVKENDFVMVVGFPGRTTEYLPSTAVRQIQDVIDPARVSVRDRGLEIINREMRRDPSVKLQYAAKQSSIANYWKKWGGEMTGLRMTNAVDKKRNFEKEFKQQLADMDPAIRNGYSSLFEGFDSLYTALDQYEKTFWNYRETFSIVELATTVNRLNGLIKAFDKDKQAGWDKARKAFEGAMDEFYKELNPEIDKMLFTTLFQDYLKNVDTRYHGTGIQPALAKAKGNWSKLADAIYGKTKLINAQSVKKILAMKPEDAIKALRKDPAFALFRSIAEAYEKNAEPRLNELRTKIGKLQRQYMKAQMEVFPSRKFYPDANSTLRLTYGKVGGYQPRDGVNYLHYTTIDGIMEKYKPGDYEFDVPARLIELYNKKDYGRYADASGRLPLCFTGSCHTTGGNSGSPAIDADGNLIGLNFDRAWESTMSDINYDPRICRNIMMDSRYLLFIIDKFAGAKNLMDEMNIIWPAK